MSDSKPAEGVKDESKIEEARNLLKTWSERVFDPKLVRVYYVLMVIWFGSLILEKWIVPNRILVLSLIWPMAHLLIAGDFFRSWRKDRRSLTVWFGQYFWIFEIVLASLNAMYAFRESEAGSIAVGILWIVTAIAFVCISLLGERQKRRELDEIRIEMYKGLIHVQDAAIETQVLIAKIIKFIVARPSLSPEQEEELLAILDQMTADRSNNTGESAKSKN